MYQAARPIRAHWRETISTAETDDITRRKRTIEAQEMGAATPPSPTLNEDAEVSHWWSRPSLTFCVAYAG